LEKSYFANFSLIYTAEVLIEAETEEDAARLLVDSDWERSWDEDATFEVWGTPDIEEV
jgi:hypothetical protein